jgi:hypothetical protein
MRINLQKRDRTICQKIESKQSSENEKESILKQFSKTNRQKMQENELSEKGTESTIGQRSHSNV